MKKFALFFVLVAGCGSEVTAVKTEQPVAASPQEVNQVLTGLYSDKEQLQLAALKALAKMPGVEKAHQERLKQLAETGKTAAVKESAKRLLPSGG